MGWLPTGQRRALGCKHPAKLHMSATQELARKVAALEAQNAALRQQGTAQAARLDQQQASLSTLQEQMACPLKEAPGTAQVRK